MVDLRKLKKTLISKMQLKELNPSKGSLNILAIAPKQDPRKTIDAFKRVMIAEEGILTCRYTDSAHIDSESDAYLDGYTAWAFIKETHAIISAAVIQLDYPLPYRSLVQIRITDKSVNSKSFEDYYFGSEADIKKRFYEKDNYEDLW